MNEEELLKLAKEFDEEKIYILDLFFKCIFCTSRYKEFINSIRDIKRDTKKGYIKYSIIDCRYKGKAEKGIYDRSIDSKLGNYLQRCISDFFVVLLKTRKHRSRLEKIMKHNSMKKFYNIKTGEYEIKDLKLDFMLFIIPKDKTIVLLDKKGNIDFQNNSGGKVRAVKIEQVIKEIYPNYAEYKFKSLYLDALNRIHNKKKSRIGISNLIEKLLNISINNNAILKFYMELCDKIEENLPKNEYIYDEDLYNISQTPIEKFTNEEIKEQLKIDDYL